MDDYISRQAAMGAINLLFPNMPKIDFMGSRRKWRKKYAQYLNAVQAIEAVPSADIGRLNRLQQAVDGKKPEEIYDFLHWLMFDFARQYTDSKAAVIEWLKGER